MSLTLGYLANILVFGGSIFALWIVGLVSTPERIADLISAIVAFLSPVAGFCRNFDLCVHKGFSAINAQWFSIVIMYTFIGALLLYWSVKRFEKSIVRE